jgi:16S rRNA (cytosine967-C5)-methyltransferase
VNASSEVKTVRQLASEILLKVDSQKAYANILLDGTLKTTHLSERDRALLTELTYGTLRWRAKIDARLSQKLRRPLADTDAFVRNLLRVTVYQLFYLDKIPDYAAVNEAVELAKTQRGSKTAGFVNGILRNVLRLKNRDENAASTDNSIAALATELSHPEWLVQRWITEFGLSEATALMRANNERAPLVLRANRLKCSRDELLAHLRDHGIAAMPTLLSPQGISIESGGNVENLPGFAEGLFQIQGESSQLVAYLLAPRPANEFSTPVPRPAAKLPILLN